MKYSVTVAGRTMEVDVVGGNVWVNGRQLTANLIAFPRTPLQQLVIDGRSRTLALRRTPEGWVVHMAGETWDAAVLDERTRLLGEQAGRQGAGVSGGVVKAPMPGLVLRVEVEVGQVLGAGAGVVVLEAMKMENEIKTPMGGVVRAIHVAPGQTVDKGVALVELTQQG